MHTTQKFTLNTGNTIPAVGVYCAPRPISAPHFSGYGGFAGLALSERKAFKPVVISALKVATTLLYLAPADLPFYYQEGYTHIDGAWIYRKLGSLFRFLTSSLLQVTEEIIGQAIIECKIPREKLFITTKLPYDSGSITHRFSTLKLNRWTHSGRVQEFFDDSLKKLGVDYVDLVRYS